MSARFCPDPPEPGRGRSGGSRRVRPRPGRAVGFPQGGAGPVLQGLGWRGQAARSVGRR